MTGLYWIVWVVCVRMDEIPNSIEFSDSEDDVILMQEANKIEGQYLRENIPNFHLGLEDLMNESTDSVESGCDLKFIESDEECSKNESKVELEKEKEVVDSDE